tara:strand:+ start:135 stop:446 length:312 start_codon:yes stop_codon:yes gene_type:complete
MINKSLAFKNKITLLFLLMLSLFIFIYLIYFLINGDRGIISYYKLKNKNYEYTIQLSKLVSDNKILADRITRLQPNTLDLDYLDEKIKEKTGHLYNNELLIIF